MPRESTDVAVLPQNLRLGRVGGDPLALHWVATAHLAAENREISVFDTPVALAWCRTAPFCTSG
jgi:hypothetical protein